jgi:hypothetical protein
MWTLFKIIKAYAENQTGHKNFKLWLDSGLIYFQPM